MKTLQLFFVFFSLVLNSSFLHAASISNSGVEVNYEYTVEFRSTIRHGTNFNVLANEVANTHAKHVFGLFHSPDYAKKHGYIADLVEGFAGTKAPVVQAAEYLPVQDEYKWVRYTATGTMLVLNKVAAAWLGGKKSGTARLPLLRDLPAIYVDDLSDYSDVRWIRCTDDYYQTAFDFSYFYNPFRCPSLSRLPLAQETEFKITLVPLKNEKQSRFPHKEIYGDNENGKLTVLYYAQGFDHDQPAEASLAEIMEDDGFKVFSRMHNSFIKDYGFTEVEGIAHLRQLLGADIQALSLETPVTLTHTQNRTFFRTYVKKTSTQTFVIRSSLLNSADESRQRGNVSFIKFWKEAWENGDFIYFGGHSGDGATLSVEDINSDLLRHQSRRLTRKLTKVKDSTQLGIRDIRFSQNKTQIVFIDACTSYDHYQDMYKEKKPNNLHLITYGHVSLFHNAETTLHNMMNLLIRPEKTSPRWMDVLLQLETDQLKSQLENLYEDPNEGLKLYNRYLKAGHLPSYLINVSVPN